MKLLAVIPSKNQRKKFTALFDDGAKVDFGGKGCKDFTIYWKENGPVVAYKKRSAYIKRHRMNEAWIDPKAPGTLSRIILWEFKTVEEGVKRYHKVLDSWKRTPSKKFDNRTANVI